VKAGPESRKYSKNKKKFQVRLPVTLGKQIVMSGVLRPESGTDRVTDVSLPETPESSGQLRLEAALEASSF
jgi:hypothetical protein